ncbi:hypothetical protein DINM_001542 [Dirofilaria immitis]|nr:hypothetical protein [Dirofilaria immitis]
MADRMILYRRRIYQVSALSIFDGSLCAYHNNNNKLVVGSASQDLITRELTGTVIICRRNCLQINMLLPYYCLIATLPLCITQILTENDLSVQGNITVQLDLNEYNQTNTNEKPFKWETCGKRFITPSKLTTHNRTHTGEKPFKCPACDKSFNVRANLNRHSLIHAGVKPFKCPVCDMSFNQHSHLKSHNRTHTGEKPFKCPVCDKSFNVRANLNRHSLIHAGVKPFKCPVCDKSFNQRSSLKSHSRTHTGEKPFKCPVCDKSFKESSSLKSHSRTHTGEKPFKCPVCDMSFNQRSNLKSHSRTHTGEKPFKCPECDKSFNQRANLDQHSLIHTSVKPHRCDVCNKQFIQRSNLKKHYQIHLRKKLLERNVCGKNFNQPVQLNYKPSKFNASSAECSGNCNLMRNKKKHENSAKLPHCNATAFTLNLMAIQGSFSIATVRRNPIATTCGFFKHNGSLTEQATCNTNTKNTIMCTYNQVPFAHPRDEIFNSDEIPPSQVRGHKAESKNYAKLNDLGEINDVESDETGECSNSGSHRDRERIKLLEDINNGESNLMANLAYLTMYFEIQSSLEKYFANITSFDLLPIRLSCQSLDVFVTKVMLKRIKPGAY